MIFVLENNQDIYNSHLNKESEDYQGDDTHKTEDDERNTHMPAIDNLSPIPEVQENF